MNKDIPAHYQKIKKLHPEYIAAVEALGETLKNTGPLDEALAQFLQLAASIAIKSEGATHSHTRQLVELGFSPNEIRHAVILLSNTLGFPSVMAGLSWVNDILENK
ncbi:MAG: carboxymuconolactone decarboxylase family protein [Bacteroidetes bacterium]|nr:carboxymuconolactone decarboxylase family protein [Bacteroidota bacterium]